MNTVTNDPLAARGNVADATVTGLAMITHVTSDRAACERFYSGVMGMRNQPEWVSSSLARADVAALLGIPAGMGWTEEVYDRPAMPGTPFVRVIGIEGLTPAIRPGMEALRNGSLSVGFSLRDMERGVTRGTDLGFPTTHGIVSLPFKRVDGSEYLAHETHFCAPDEVYGLGVGRPEDLATVAPIPFGENVGGPAYSAQVANHGDEVLAFYRDLLGFEIRRDVALPYGQAMDGALRGVRPGTVMRFVQMFAPGTDTAYLVFLDFADLGLPAVVEPRAPNRGVAAWTFRVKDLRDLLRRAASAGHRVACPMRRIESPAFGACEAASLLAPNGFLVELIEPAI